MATEVLERTDWRQMIVSTPDVLSGKPRINGTRISVALILGYLAEGYSPDKIIHEFPDLNREQLIACVNYAEQNTRARTQL